MKNQCKHVLGFLLLVIFVLLLSMGTVFAKAKTIQVKIGGKGLKVRPVPVYADGVKLESTVPSFVLVDRTLVPIRFISENFGLSVEWEGTSKTVTVEGNEKKILLKIDSSAVLLNGSSKELDRNSVPRLVTFPGGDTRTMVPLRFISEVMGYKVGWNDEKGHAFVNSEKYSEDRPSSSPTPNPAPTNVSEIQAIRWIPRENNVEKVEILTSSQVQFAQMYSDRENKLYINISDCRDGAYSKSFLEGLYANPNTNIKDIEVLQISTEPSLVQLIISMIKKEPYELRPAKTNPGLELVVGKQEEQVSQQDQPSGGTVGNLMPTPSNPKDGRLHRIDRIVQDGESIRIVGAGKAMYNVIELKDPTRVVLDLMSAELQGDSYKDYKYKLGFIENVRAAQFEPDKNYAPTDIIVRIVMDVRQGIINPKLRYEVQGEDLIIIPEKTAWDMMKYSSSGNTSEFEIPLLNLSKYEIAFDSNVRALVISVPSDSVTIEDQVVDVTDSMLSAIKIQTEGERKKFYLSFRRNVEYRILSEKTEDRSVRLNFTRKASNKPQDYLIVLDPGHGGSDSGAISVRGRYEKDVNLKVSTLVRKKLASMGYNVIMLREDDKGIPLFERPRLANDLFPDVFVSIHANSVDGNPKANGIETHYWNGDEVQKNRSDQSFLSKYILEETLKRTGAANRRVRKTPFVVVKYTNMSASLIEMGFLTNHEEEAKLFDPSYQEKMADGIAAGIMRYIQEFK